MADKTKFLDYEGLTRPRGGRLVDHEEIEGSFSPGVSEHGTVSPFRDGKPGAGKDTSRKEGRLQVTPGRRVKHGNATKTVPLSSLLKRGHALSFAGVFLFTFTVFFRPYELFPTLSWASSSAFVTAVITLAIYIPTQLGLGGGLTVRLREVNLALLLLVACLLSIPFALSPSTAWKSFGDVAKVIVIFIVIVNVVRTEQRLKRLLLLVLAASCIVSISALNDYRLGRLALQGRRIEGVIGGLFGNPNDLALHLVTMIPISVGLMLGSKGSLKKALYLCCAFLMIAGLMATFSRGGFVGLICVAGALLWSIARKNSALVLALLAVLAFGFLAVAPRDYRNRLFTTEDGSAVARTDDLKRSIFLTVRHPFFGVGLGNYIFYSNSSKATHNAYTQVGSELGVAAMVVYILFLVTPLRRLRAIRRASTKSARRSPLQWLAIGLEASLVGYMVTSFFASVATQWYAYYLVAYALCLHRIIDSRGIAETVEVRREHELPLGNRPGY